MDINIPPSTPTDDNYTSDALLSGQLISDEEALKLVNDTFADYDHGRKPFERQWYRSILFLLGNQWIIWDTIDNKWRKKRLANWVPTPVTNKYAASGQRLVSVLARIEPNWTFTPASPSAKDVSAAEQCKSAQEVICEENHIENVRAQVAPWVVYTGNAYLLSGVEPIMGPEPATEEMPPTGMLPEAMPQMGGMPGEIATPNPGSTSSETLPNTIGGTPEVNRMMGTSAEQATGLPQMAMPTSQPTDYKLFTDVLAPFEVYADQTIADFDDQIKVMVVNRRSREYVKNLWGVDIDELDVAPNIHYQESIGYVTSSPEITGFLASLSRIKRVTVKRLYCKPTSKYPKGLYIVSAGSKILEKAELPQTVEGDPYVPISHIKFDNIPGAFFGRTPMDDILHKQIQRNKIESLIELIALRMGSPIWLMPEGTVVRNFTGEPGAVINYSMVGEKASKPDRIPGEQIPTSIVQFLASIDKDIEDLVSTFEALKGQSPYSGAPGVVIEQLIEQGLTRFGPSLRNVAEGYRQWMKHQLEFFRVYGIAEKTVMTQGDGTVWTSKQFKGADIEGAVNVRIESDSTVPRSSQVETAKILEAINAGLVDVSNPIIKQKVLQKLKIQDLQDDVERDLVIAATENEGFPQNMMPEVTQFLDNHPIHIYQHNKFANSEEGAAFRQAIMYHVTQHHMFMQAEMTPGPSQMAQSGPQPSGSSGGPVDQNALNPGAPAKGQLPPGIQ